MELTATKPNTAKAASKAESEEIVSVKPHRTDAQIWGIYIGLFLISIVELYSASSHEVKASNIFGPFLRHILFLVTGLGMMLVLQRTHYQKFLKWTKWFATVSVLFMAYTLVNGDYINGARRSFSIGIASIQPAEMLKLSAVLVIALILCRSQKKGMRDVTDIGLWRVTGAVMLFGGLLFFQGLTNTLLLMAISLSMMVIGGVSLPKIGKAFIVLVVFAVAGLGIKVLFGTGEKKAETAEDDLVVPGTEYVVARATEDSKVANVGRLQTWVNRVNRHFKTGKWRDTINDENQQEQYSYLAQAHGGVFGVMPGNSRETARLPLAFSDYIYAIIIEELGLAGGIVVLVLYLWLLARASVVCRRCQTAFPAFLVLGMAVFIVFQAIVHMCIVTGVFPVSGQPLPLISKGGTSIWITSIAFGVMLSVSRFAARKNKNAEIKQEMNILSEDLKAQNPT